jgi:hypothetical protein
VQGFGLRTLTLQMGAQKPGVTHPAHQAGHIAQHRHGVHAHVVVVFVLGQWCT